MNSNQSIVAEVPATDNITLRITATVYGWSITHLFADGAEVWDGRTYTSEANVREAANREWVRLREAAKVAA